MAHTNNDLNQLMMRSLTNGMGIPNPNNWDIHKMLQKYSYAFLVMYVLNKVGIDHEALVIKAIAKVQQDLDAVMNDLNKLKQLLQELQNQGWGTESDGKTSWDPSKHTDAENVAHMKGIIEAWMNGTDTPGGPTHLQQMKDIWTDLFGKNGQGGGLEDTLKKDLADPNYDQSKSSKQIIGVLDGLNGGSFSGKTDPDWQSGGVSFLDILQDKAGISDDTVATIFSTVFCHSYYNRTGSHPTEKDHKTPDPTVYTDDIGDVNNDFETTKETLNGLNTTESSDLSMFSQNLTSMIQEGQQVIQYYSQETQGYANNQKGQ